MAKFAPVCGIDMMEALLAAGPDFIGPYHLWLVHDVLRDVDRWVRLASDIQKCHHEKVQIIMDNSLIELGTPLAGPTLIQTALAVSADYLVLPDVLEDRNETLRLSEEFIKENHSDLKGIKLLGVVQGQKEGELLYCANKMVEWGCSALSVPRIVTKRLGSRQKIVREIGYTHPSTKIHLLGFSDNLDDDVATARQKATPTLEGIDSAVPIRVGQSGRLLDQYTSMKAGKRAEDYLDSLEAPNPYTLVNILEFRRRIF